MRVFVMQGWNSDRELTHLALFQTEEGAYRAASRFIHGEELELYTYDDPMIAEEPDGQEANRNKAYKRFKEMYQQEKYKEMFVAYMTFCVEHREEYYWYHSAEIEETEVQE